MVKVIIWPTILSLFAALIQSAILSRIEAFKAIPDIALCIIVYSAYINGSMVGQVTGFTSGLLIDFISIAPLGFNALLRTCIGALMGFLKGSFFLDIAVLPIVLCILATFLKVIIAWFIGVLFPLVSSGYGLSASVFWFELLYNGLIAPAVFAFLKLFSSVLNLKKDN